MGSPSRAVLFRALAPVAIASGTLLAGCGLLNQYPETRAEDSASTCSDGVDDDLDGRTDCRDSGCAEFCKESDLAACRDRKDNDADGFEDCRDPDCDDYCREDDASTCSNGRDDDGDGLEDCADPACIAVPVCLETTEAACSDDRDNDADDLVDCNDASCAAFCAETGSRACSDGEDNDFDALIDCTDPSCDGSCPEADPALCNDQRDNDGDTLTDPDDPSCWPFLPPVVDRCAAFERAELHERFDLASDDGWYRFGEAQGTVIAPASRNEVLTGRNDFVQSFGMSTAPGEALGDNLGGLASITLVAGSFASFELSFAAAVLDNSKLRVALVPAQLAPESETPKPGAEAALLSVTLDRASERRLFSLEVEGHVVSKQLPPLARCASTYCEDGWAAVSVAMVDGMLVATVKGVEIEETLELAAPSSGIIPSSRVVVWGGSTSESVTASIDDLRVEVPAVRRCGLDVPQIPRFESACVQDGLTSAGTTVSMARSPNGDLCALLGSNADGGAEADRTTSFRSRDGGATWERTSDTGGAPSPVERDALIGAGVAWDGAAELFLRVSARVESDGVRLAFSSSPDCADWSEPEAGPLLPRDAEAPSYLWTDGRHEVYFTRPANEAIGRTLWRASGRSATTVAFEPMPLAELPPEASGSGPVSIQRVGTSDLVMVYRTLPLGGATGLGLLVGNQTASTWSALPSVPFLAASGEPTFDADGLTAGALAWDAGAGFLLYGGLRDGVKTGTALLRPACAPGSGECDAIEPAPPAFCGDGTCQTWESCDRCDADCACAGAGLIGDAFSDADAWTGLGDDLSAIEAYLVGDELAFRTYFPGAIRSWVERPLDRPLLGDFELAFDVFVGRGSGFGPRCGYLLVGIGTSSADATVPEGVFVKVADASACLGEDLPLDAVAQVGDEGISTEVAPEEQECGPRALSIAPGAASRVALRRVNGEVSVRSVADGCGVEKVMRYPGALPPLTSLLVGWGADCPYPNALGGSVGGLTLRRLDDPERCGDDQISCGDDDAFCVDTDTSPEHCGGCFNPCGAGERCEAGSCECLPELTSCGDGCVDTRISKEHCGGCDQPCAGTCQDGECIPWDYSCGAPRPIAATGGTLELDFAESPEPDPMYTCDYQTNHNVVVSWTPERSGYASVALQGAEIVIDTVLGISDTATCDPFLTCNDDAFGLDSQVFFAAEAGIEYRIVAGVLGEQANYPSLRASLTVVPP